MKNALIPLFKRNVMSKFKRKQKKKNQIFNIWKTFYVHLKFEFLRLPLSVKIYISRTRNRDKRLRLFVMEFSIYIFFGYFKIDKSCESLLLGYFKLALQCFLAILKFVYTYTNLIKYSFIIFTRSPNLIRR